MQQNRFVLDPRGGDKEEKFRETLLETLKTATILSVEHQVGDIPISSFDQELPTLIRRSEETLTITYVPDRDAPALPVTAKTEKEDRKTIGETLVKKKPK